MDRSQGTWRARSVARTGGFTSLAASPPVHLDVPAAPQRSAVWHVCDFDIQEEHRADLVRGMADWGVEAMSRSKSIKVQMAATHLCRRAGQVPLRGQGIFVTNRCKPFQASQLAILKQLGVSTTPTTVRMPCNSRLYSLHARCNTPGHRRETWTVKCEIRYGERSPVIP